MNKFSLITVLGFFFVALLPSCQQSKPKQSPLILAGGEHIRIDSFSSEYIDTKRIDIWFPPSYQSSDSLGVIYMHDGQALFDGTTTWNGQEWGIDEYFTSAIDQQGYIVVGVWNAGANRWTQYFPEKALEYMPADSLNMLYEMGMDTVFNQLSANNYLRFLVEELKPFIEEEFRVKSNPKHTAIMGSSMGGLISWYGILEYPDVFGAALCLSTHWPGIFTNENNPIPNAFLSYLSDNINPSKRSRFYFDTGTIELDSLYLEHQLRVDSIFAQKGFTTENYMSKVFEGAGHNEDYWRARLSYPFGFLTK